MEVLVSIIVPCYKHAHYLDESLQSVLNQTYSHWECIIVDDGSPDNTKEVAKKWLDTDGRFIYLEKQNGGLSSARNEGVKIAKGEYILPLDADDLLDSQFLEKLVPVLTSNSNLGIVSCYTKFFVQSKENVIYQLKPKGNYWKNLLFVNQLVATSLYRKSCWLQVCGYDESMKTGFEDWDFWLNVTKKGWEYLIVEDFLFYYRKAKKSMLVDTINNHFESNREYICKKHKELYIEDFENCMEVLFYEIKTHRVGKMKLKNSIEYKIGKVFTMPFRWFTKLVLKNK